MTVTIEVAAEELAFRLSLPVPDGESSAAFRLDIARALRIRTIRATLLHLAAEGTLRLRYPDGGYLPAGGEAYESSQVDLGEAQAALEGNGWRFEGPGRAETALASDVAPVATTAPSAAKLATTSSKAPELLQRWQEREVLRVIRELGYDPKSLPKQDTGKPGVKTEVRKALRDPSFTPAVFKKAWERLRAYGDISDRG